MSDLITTGIDVSRVQAVTSYQRIRDAGYRFLIAKAVEGEKYVDPSMAIHINGANGVGMLTGVYAFALPDEDAKDDVAALLESIKPLEARQPLDFPATLDLETRNKRTAKQTLLFAHDWSEEYRDKERMGRYPWLYTSPSFWGNLVREEPAMAMAPYWKGRVLWTSHYTNAAKPLVTAPWGDWGDDDGPKLWQWAASDPKGPLGRVPGIVGLVDLDRFAGRYDDLRRLAGLAVALPSLPG